MTGKFETETPANGVRGMTEAEARGISGAEGVAALSSAEALPDMADPMFPGPVAEALYYDDATVAAIQGPVGSGKTTTVLKSRLRRAMAMPISVIDHKRHYKLVVVRETYRQLWSTTIPDFLGVYPKALGEWSGGKGGPVTFVMPYQDEHGEIIFTVEFMAFGDDIVASMRGLQATDFWLHEMDTNPLDVLITAMGRINRYPARGHFEGYAANLRSYGQIIGDMNAPEEDNWAFAMFDDPAQRERVVTDMSRNLPEGTPPVSINFHRQPGFGEPGTENMANLAPGYYQNQIAINRLAGRSDMTERMVHNRSTHLKIGDPVFEREFNARIHVAAEKLEPARDVPLRLGFDQGFKGAAVIGQFLEPDHWQIYACLFFPKERLMAATFGDRLFDLLETPRFAQLRNEGGWGDMAGEHGASQGTDENATWNRIVSKHSGVRIKPQRIGTNRIQPRLEAVRAPLERLSGSRPGLLICPTCRPLIAAFSARYVWADEIDKNGDKRKVPDKSIAEANVMDALQYLLLSEVSGDGTGSRPSVGSRERGRGDGRNAGKGGLTTGYSLLEEY